MARYLYSELASLVDACHRCKREGNPHAADHLAVIERLVKNHLPSGSGFNNGTQLDLGASHAGKLVFHTAFRHMNNAGYYSGWTEHTVTVTPAFSGVNIRIGGRNRNQIKDYIHEAFDLPAQSDIEWDLYAPHYRVDIQNNKAGWYQVVVDGTAEPIAHRHLEDACQAAVRICKARPELRIQEVSNG